MAILHPTTDGFEGFLKDNKLALVDFFATWCGPCKMVAPLIEEISDEFEGRAAVAKVDVDEAPELAAQYGVESIPTVILFKDGKPVTIEVGARAKDFYATMIENHL